MPCRPLELRQPFIFYLGHLPAFTDARLARVLQQQLTDPVQYADMFARGIDPDLDDPTQCKGFVVVYTSTACAGVFAVTSLGGSVDNDGGSPLFRMTLQGSC